MWGYITAIVSRATLVDWLLLLFGVLLILYIAGTWNYDYFQRRGIPSTKPKFPFVGDMAPALLGRRAFPDIAIEQYKWSEGHSVFGIFEFVYPSFLIRDLEILKVVAVKDFEKYMNHRTIENEKSDPVFNKNLFNIKDQQWRDMRTTLSPAFTTSKIKGMFPLISQCGEQLAQHLRQKYADSKTGTQGSCTIDMKDLFSRFSNDNIATAVFGISCDSLKNPENEFYQMGKKLTTFTKLRGLTFLGYMFFPKLAQALGLHLLDVKATAFFNSLVHETIRERQKKGIFRPDVLQLLMQAREGELQAEKEDAAETENVGVKKKLTDDDISAQAGVFFFAGFETVSVALCLTTHLLSHHQDVQKRLQAEITDMLETTGGKPTYEGLQSMKYLDAVINETLRLYPPVVATDRQCKEDTTLAVGTGSVSVRKGQVVLIPVMGIHHDPQHWEDPERFDPERFNEENKHKIKPFTYMPFGLGPRICIGQRLALIEVKLALVHLLSSFDLLPSSKTKYPLEFSPGFNVMARGGFWCELALREE